MLIALDSGPLGDLINPNNTPEAIAVRRWMAQHLLNGDGFLLAEINDYEIRRSEILGVLIKRPDIGPAQGEAAIHLLNQLKSTIIYSPLSTTAMLKAAELWADQRKGHGKGHASRSDKLDGDVILTAQCLIESESRGPIIIATMNLKDFLFTPTPHVTADEWNNI